MKEAYDIRLSMKVPMINPTPVYTVVGRRKYFRLVGRSRSGITLSVLVTEAEANEYGVPQRIPRRN